MHKLIIRNRILILLSASVVTISAFKFYRYFDTIKSSRDNFYLAEVIQKNKISNNLTRLKLKLNESLKQDNVSSPYHVIVRDVCSQIYRYYTPISVDREHLELVYRSYKDGIISGLLDSTQVGGKVSVSGIQPTQTYVPNTVKNLVMIAGGTGILPFYQLSSQILADPKDLTNLFIAWSCHSVNDLFLKDELTTLREMHPKRLNFTIFITGEDGYNSKDILFDRINEKNIGHLRTEKLTANSSNSSHEDKTTFAIVCGPDKFCEKVIGTKFELGILSALGYKSYQMGRLWEGG